MSESVNFKLDKSLLSEVEINKHLIRVDDKLYSPGQDFYIVTELFEGGFSAKCEWEENDFYFCELQKGWFIMESTKRNHILYDKFNYV